MKKIYVLFFTFLLVPVFGQVQNVTVTSCNNVTKSIYGVLSGDHVLMVVSNGLDCSNCQGAAPGLQNFAANHSAKIEVWGAMTFLYDQNSIPTCNQISTWNTTYSWTSIFTFRDTDRYWFQTATPHFYVYDPVDSLLAYDGFSESAATSEAVNLADALSEKEIQTKPAFSISSGDGFIMLNNLPLTRVRVQLINITGKEVRSLNTLVGEDGLKITTDDLPRGLYIIDVKTNEGFRAVRKLYLH